MAIFFTKNGRSYGIAAKNLEKKSWYPTIGIHALNSSVEVNFGQFEHLKGEHDNEKFRYLELSNYGKKYILINYFL